MRTLILVAAIGLMASILGGPPVASQEPCEPVAAAGGLVVPISQEPNE